MANPLTARDLECVCGHGLADHFGGDDGPCYECDCVIYRPVEDESTATEGGTANG